MHVLKFHVFKYTCETIYKTLQYFERRSIHEYYHIFTIMRKYRVNYFILTLTLFIETL